MPGAVVSAHAGQGRAAAGAAGVAGRDRPAGGCDEEQGDGEEGRVDPGAGDGGEAVREDDPRVGHAE